MVVSKKSLAYKLVMVLPAWVPIGIEAVRVGSTVSQDVFRIRSYGFRHWHW